MSLSTKRLMVALVLAAVLALPLAQVPNVYSAELTAPEKALTFLRDVVGLDMTKYNAKLVFYQSYPADMGGYAKAEAKYTLESAAGGTIDVIVDFRNNALVSCSLYRCGGSTLYAETPPTNMLAAVKGLIQRYQIYSGAAYLQPMRDMLDTVTEIKPMAVTWGNVKLRISNIGIYTDIDWIYTINGLDVPGIGIGFSFENGSLLGFRNTWGLYKVGTTELKVSREEAIRIAKERVQSYSYKVGNITVSNFGILDELVTAELSWAVRENNTLYPWWSIFLYLDKLYPGMVRSIQVTLWADTGEVTHIVPISAGGAPVPTVPPTEPPPDGSTGLDPTPFIIAVPIVLAIILGATFYRRKRKD